MPSRYLHWPLPVTEGVSLADGRGPPGAPTLFVYDTCLAVT